VRVPHNGAIEGTSVMMVEGVPYLFCKRVPYGTTVDEVKQNPEQFPTECVPLEESLLTFLEREYGYDSGEIILMPEVMEEGH
jgi:hypothetical protein